MVGKIIAVGDSRALHWNRREIPRPPQRTQNDDADGRVYLAAAGAPFASRMTLRGRRVESARTHFALAARTQRPVICAPRLAYAKTSARRDPG